MKIIITENKLKQSLLKSIDEVGYIETSEIVGGFENLFNIIGEEKVVDLFISLFTDLHLTKRDDGITLYDWNLPMIKKYFDDSFLRTTLIVNHSSIALRILSKLGDEGIALYGKYKDDFINELISMFPELSDKSNLNESKLANSLIDQIKKDGWLETAELVGGPENLFSIIGESKKNVIKYLLSFYNDLKIEGRGGSKLYLVDKGLPLLELNNFFYLGLRAYDSYFRYRLDENSIELYEKFRRDLIKELVKIYPEFYTDGEVTVYKDSGLYDTIDRFRL
jgi:hypothetical protein